MGKPTLQGDYKAGEMGAALPPDGGLKARTQQVYQKSLEIQRGEPNLAKTQALHEEMKSLNEEIMAWSARAKQGGSTEYQIDRELIAWEYKKLRDQSKAVRDLLAKLQNR